ncbi:Pol polyprotein [Elysia marginata]|uniref:Pol polyprotein n=1 Tax=Elysia marginata TaxID=1093978 RepID=A0AAV4H0J7_9GAST|nr:Pol polyprotein [Elysia marginata]
MAASCDACQRSKPKNQKEPLHQHDEGNTPWEKVGLDFCEFGNRQYLIVVDYFSNFIEVEHMTSTTTAHTISKLKQLFARYGIPKTIVSDNGPQFTAEKFQQFAKRWNILHKTSSPGHPQANGKAEAAVKIIKMLMKRATNAETDPYKALLELRNTPRQDVGLSPAQIMFGRSRRSMLPSRPEQQKLTDQTFQDRREHRRSSSKKYFDRLSKTLPKLSVGQRVYYEQFGNNKKWASGVIQSDLEDRSYIIKGDNGGSYRRNRKYMRPSINPPIPQKPTACMSDDLAACPEPDNTSSPADVSPGG